MHIEKKVLPFLILMSLFIQNGCNNIPNDIVELKNVDYKVVKISAPDTLVYNPSDSSFTSSLSIENTETVKKVWFSISTLDGTDFLKENVVMSDNGDTQGSGDKIKDDGIYSGKTILGKNINSAKYEVDYFIEDNIRKAPENIVKVGIKEFYFQSAVSNSAPVLSDLSMPDSVNRGESFIFSIKVDDVNGLTDIAGVYFELYRPDSTIVNTGSGDTKFPMFDDGNVSQSGDETAGDGIYSLKNSFVSTSQTGLWRFEFRAFDRAHALSNSITKKLLVK